MNEYESVKQYLKSLEKALKGLDPALIADALDDAEEHLELATEEYIKSGKFESSQEALEAAIKEYGLPSDIAEEYMRLEPEKEPIVPKKRSLLYQIFGVYVERQTYLNLIYLLLQFPLGLIYFLYIVPAVLVILVLFITLVGIPLGILFLLSIFGLSWFHGRISEAFLGIRMPQKRRKFITGASQERMRNSMKDVTDFGRFTSSPTWQKTESILKDVRLYTSTAYLFLTFPLGIIYFVVFVALFSSTASLIVPPIDVFQPLLTELFEGTWAHFGLAQFGTTSYTNTYPIFGFILLTGTLHLSNMLARLHGRMTKALLVKR
ncbi:MAG: sensor domain-containing protein [Theionarchaea archaeon]|nr:sensor domain-containing protein [Theionarchaea archaeon]